MFDFLSLRGRFLITPIIGIILTLVLYIGSNAIIQSHSTLLQELHESNLPQISGVSNSIALLANNHNNLTEILLSSLESPDEEMIYIEGRNILNRLHEIETQLFKTINSQAEGFTERKNIHNQIHEAFLVYRDSTISAIELSSVDSKLAVNELRHAGKAMRQLNNKFLALSKHHSQYLSNTSSLIGNTLNNQSTVTVLAIALIILMVFSALYFSGRMSADLEKYEKSLIDFRLKAEKANEAKSNFLSSMSHELRTPLTAIKGGLDLLTNGLGLTLPDKANVMLDIANRNVRRLLTLINDILDVSKLESGEFNFLFEDLEAKPFIESNVELNQAYAKQHNTEFICKHIDENIILNVDKDRLSQVMSNLLSNAAKYSPDNVPVEIFTSINNENLRVSIKDYGSGVPEEFQNVLFDKFTQSSSGDTRKVGGTGLGLNISQMIIEKLGGEIGFNTIIDKETTFYFELPILKD